MTDLRKALAQPEQDPVAWRNMETGEFCTGGFLRKDLAKWMPLYTPPPKREWVGLTDDDFNVKKVGEFDVVKFAKYIETLLKERNFGSAD